METVSLTKEIIAAVNPQKLSVVKETAKTMIIKRAQQGFRIVIGSKVLWPGLGNKTGLYDFKYDIMSKLWKTKGERFQTNLDKALKTRVKIKVLDYRNIDNKKAIWEPVMEITIKPSRK